MKSSARRSLPRLVQRPQLHHSAREPRVAPGLPGRHPPEWLGALEQALPASPATVPPTWREAFEHKVLQALTEPLRQFCDPQQFRDPVESVERPTWSGLRQATQELAHWRPELAAAVRDLSWSDPVSLKREVQRLLEALGADS